MTGHIDGTGIIKTMRQEGNAVWVTIEAKKEILGLIVDKGSICIDGISLTVAETSSTAFSVSVIPHTGEETSLLGKKPGSKVNLENDVIGKYVRKLLLDPSGLSAPVQEKAAEKEEGLTMAFLEKYGI